MRYGNLPPRCARCHDPILDTTQTVYEMELWWHLACLQAGKKQLEIAMKVLQRRRDDDLAPYDENDDQETVPHRPTFATLQVPWGEERGVISPTPRLEDDC